MRSTTGGPCCHCGRVSSPCWRRGPPDLPILCNACGARWLTKRDLTGYFPGAKAARRLADGAAPRPRAPRPGVRKRKASGKRYSGDGILPMKRAPSADDGGESRYTPPGGGSAASSPLRSPPHLARTTPPPPPAGYGAAAGAASSSSRRIAGPPVGLPALFAAVKTEAVAPATPNPPPPAPAAARRRRKPDRPRQSVLV